MRTFKLCAAIPLLIASWNATALDPATTVAAPVQLVVAGSSAARDTFLEIFLTACQAGTANLYRANPVTLQDFRAYSCTLLNAAPVPLALRNFNVAVYYRSEGGSGWGVGSILKNLQIKRLVVDAACTVAVPPVFGSCAVAGYNLNSDTFAAGHLVSATTDLGVGDLEPENYRGENWVGMALGGEPPFGSLEAMSRSVVFAQVFSVLVNNNVPTTSISKVELRSMLAGVYSDWSQIQDPPTGNPLPSQPVTICRYSTGSGVQTLAAEYFLNQKCGVISFPSVTAPLGPNGNPVFDATTVIGLENCVAANPGAVGISVARAAAPAGTKYVAISGLVPSKVSAARALYELWFEGSMSKRPGLAGLNNTFADMMISFSRARGSIPGGSASAFAVPGIAGNIPVLPVAAAGTPVGVATSSGRACQPPIGQL